jgi:hypothetical protein
MTHQFPLPHFFINIPCSKKEFEGIVESVKKICDDESRTCYNARKCRGVKDVQKSNSYYLDPDRRGFSGSDGPQN